MRLWVTWAWVEARPGKFVFADYDELLDPAKAQGSEAVLSTIAEIQPTASAASYRTTRMVDSRGQRVVSSNRAGLSTTALRENFRKNGGQVGERARVEELGRRLEAFWVIPVKMAVHVIAGLPEQRHGDNAPMVLVRGQGLASE